MPTLRYRRIGAFLWWGGYQALADCQIQTPITGYNVRTKDAQLLPDGRLTMFDRYAWDGPTYGIKTDDFVAGSGFHDILCEFINAGMLPETEQCKADELMLNLNIKSNMHPFRRAYTYAMVRGYQLRKKRPIKRKIYEVAF